MLCIEASCDTMPCRLETTWKLQTFRRIVNVSKSRCLTSCLLIRLSITEVLNFHDRVNMSLSFFPTQNQMTPVYLFRSFTVGLYLFKIHSVIIPSSAPSSSMGFLSFFVSWQILYTLLISPIPCTFLASLHQSIATGTEYDSFQLYCSNFNWLSSPCPCISHMQYTKSKLTPWCAVTPVLSHLQHFSVISWTVLWSWRHKYVRVNRA